MLLLSDFISDDDAVWIQLRRWVTNSTVTQLLRRLIIFGSDLYTIQEIKSHNEIRAREIASERLCLAPLVGNLVKRLPDQPMDPFKIFDLFELLMPRWQEITRTFNQVNSGLCEAKYAMSTSDPNYRDIPNPIENLENGTIGLKKEFMPLPALCFLIRPLQYVPLNIFFFIEKIRISTFLDWHH